LAEVGKVKHDKLVKQNFEINQKNLEMLTLYSLLLQPEPAIG